MTQSRQKEIGLVVVSALYSLLVFMVYALVLRGNSGWSTIYVLMLIVAGIVWAALYSVILAFFANRTSGVSALVVVPPAIFAYALGGLTISAAVAAGLLLGFLLATQRYIVVEVRDRVRMRITRVFASGTRVLLFGFILSLIIIALPSVQTGVQRGTIQLSPGFVRAVTAPATPLIRQILPGYEQSATIDQLLDAYIAQQQQNLPPGFEIPPGERERVRQELSQQFGIQLRGGETVAQATATYVNQYIQGAFTQAVASAAAGGVAVFAFGLLITLVALRALVSMLMWPTYAVIYLMVYFSERIGLVSKLNAQVTVQQYHL
ncbi:MAG: hypothetical protein WEC84_04610 [Candidatus Andersenbacteria bacterium]